MRRAGLHFCGIVATLTLISACGGPAGPSKTTETATPPAPGPSGAKGTIALVSATPAPGAELAAPSLSATFSVTVDRAIQDAALEVRILDGSDRSCGFASTDRQHVTAGEAASFTVAALTISCSPPATLETLSATLVGAAASQRTEYLAATIPAHYSLRAPDTTVTLRGTVTESGVGVSGASVDIIEGANAGKGTTTDGTGGYVLAGLTPGAAMVRAWKTGYDNSYQRVTLSDSSTTQDFGVSKAPKPGPAASGIVFLGSDPAPGSETVMTEAAGFIFLRDLKMQFSVHFDTALPDAKLQVQLFGDSGQECAYSFVDYAIPASQTVVVPVDGLAVWQTQTCGVFPVGISSVKATLLTLRGPEVNGRLQRTDYVSQSFSVRYTVRRYPPPPPGAPAAAPVISELVWKVMLPVGGDPPIPGDPVSISCTARETDGAPMTLTLTLTWDGRAPNVYTSSFPAGASSSPGGARLGITVSAPNNGQPAPHARLECEATNVRGETVRKSTDIGRAPQ